MVNDKYKELIVKYLTDRISADEEKELASWLEEHEDHKTYFEEAKSIWALSGEHDIIYSPDTKREWARFINKVKSLREEPKVVRLKQDRTVWYKVAAVVLLTLGLGYAVKTIIYSSSSEQATVAVASPSDKTELATTDRLNIFYLPDSSIVWLNKNSKLSYAKSFNEKERRVVLEGEGFFNVRKDASKPFIIEAAGTETKVLGTSFNLNAYPQSENVEVVVVTGKVSFGKEENKVDLAKNDKGSFRNSSNKLEKEKNKDLNFIAWKNDSEAVRSTAIYQREQLNRKAYIYNKSKWRTNAINQTVIEGTLENTAIFTSYRRVKMKVVYYDDKGSKTGESYFTLSKKIAPGTTVPYKHRLLDWFQNTSKVEISIDNIEEFNDIF